MRNSLTILVESKCVEFSVHYSEGWTVHWKGLFLILMRNPGTSVPGYFLSVPTGRKMANLQGWPFGRD
jgi:hypothetical protein